MAGSKLKPVTLARSKSARSAVGSQPSISPSPPRRAQTDTAPDTTKTTTAATADEIRPTLKTRQSTNTRYVRMLLSLDTIPRLHNILASFFSWILLAGFLVFPGTFTSLISGSSSDKNGVEVVAARVVKNIPLLAIASTCAVLGAVGMLVLWRVHSSNYVWLLNRIFLPGLLNSLAGLISTLVSVYTQQGGSWSVTAKVTAFATGGCMVVMSVFSGMYHFWALRRVQRQHRKEERARGIYDEETGDSRGLVDRDKEKMKARPLEPGSIV